jgi:AcrR family transcriptional regulator
MVNVVDCVHTYDGGTVAGRHERSDEVARVTAEVKQEHRRRLLDAAAEEFALKGYAGAKVDDISVAAGFARSTIYNYFESKEAVFRAVLADFSQRSTAATTTIPEDGSVEARLLALARADQAVLGEREAFTRVAFRELLTQPVEVTRALWPNRAVDPFDERLRRIVEDGQNSGEIRSDRSVEELARMFAVLSNGLLLEHWLPDSPIKMGDIPRLLVDYFLEGAGAKPTL